MVRGRLIVFEGLDRAGKSTQCEHLVKALQDQGHKVKHMRFPDRTTPIGKMIDSYLKGQSHQDDHVIHLLFSANRWEAATGIVNDIKEGITVVIDRYYYSGIVYSAAKNNPSLSLQWARKPEEGLPRPDLCLFLSLTPAEAAARGGYGNERYEEQGMQRHVSTLFKVLQDSSDGAQMKIVDAGKTMQEVRENINEIVQDLMAKEPGELGRIQAW